MKFDERESGLLVPSVPPANPPRRYGPIEIQDEKRRELAKAALSQLWDAMNLTAGTSQILFPGESPQIHDARHRLYRYLGESLLGDDCPEGEVWT